MIKNFILVVALFMSPVIEAQITLGFGIMGRFQSDINPDRYKNKNTLAPFSGYRWTQFEFIGEYSAFSETSQKGTISINIGGWAMTPWLRYHLQVDRRWSPYLGLGLEVYQESVTLKTINQTLTRQGELELSLAACAGVNITVWSNLVAEVEGRILSEPDGDQWKYDLIGRLGWIF